MRLTKKEADSYTDDELVQLQHQTHRWNNLATSRSKTAQSPAWGVSEEGKRLATREAKDAAEAMASVDSAVRRRFLRG